MPSVKCGGCAKFLSLSEAVKCSKCNALYHRACAALPITGFVAPTWSCPECVKKVVRVNKAPTPLRGEAETSPANGTALDVTTNFATDLAEELRLFKVELRTELQSMSQEIQQLRAEVVQLKDSFYTCDERMNGLEARVDDLEYKLAEKVTTDSDPLINTINELKCQLNERDQELLLNDVEVSGIPESKGESTMHLVTVLCTKLGIPLDDKDVVHAERVGSTRRNQIETFEGSASADSAAQRPRSICIRFARRTTRNALLSAARVRRGLNTNDLEVAGPSRRVYINERLTRTNRSLFYNARQAGSRHGWRYVWTKEGKILVRKEDGRKAERVKCEADIGRIFG